MATKARKLSNTTIYLFKPGARLLLRRLGLRHVPVPLPRLVEVLVRALVIRQAPDDVKFITLNEFS